MKRSERHKLKTDEFVSGVEHMTEWSVTHRAQLINAALLIVGASLLLVGLWTYRSRQTHAAEVALTEAMKQFNAPVVREGTDDRPALSFTTDKERYEASRDAFASVATDFGNYDPGRKARYYQGVCNIGLLDYEAAVEAFELVRGGDRDLIYYLATMSMASSKAELSDHQGANELFLALLNDPSSPLPKDHLLFQLGKSEEEAGNTEQAEQYYDRFVNEHPDSQLIRDVEERQEILAHGKKT